MNVTGNIDYKTLSDSQLLELLKASDHHAFTEIYNRYFYLVYVHAYKKLRDEEQTKDIVQELFVNLWANKENSFAVRNLAVYLIISVRNKIFDLFDHQNVEAKYIDSLKGYLNTGNIAHTDYLIREKELKNYIEKAIQRLPTRMRQIFELSRKENLSNRKIAERLNTTESNVSQHLSNATKILRTKLGAVFFFIL